MEIIVYLIECSVCLSIFCLFYRTVLQSQTSYQFNRWYLLGTGIGAGCDAEAERVIRESIPWNPGEQRGKFVKVRLVLPITFRLGD
uniref:Energy transducer TonB n=1 Tax=Roseihalotalea indica TaxID=2867963 RepID=A0AA49GJT4_9BACT|nr:energy transducer TonB [Tunicatimonas sp. TK19036]